MSKIEKSKKVLEKNKVCDHNFNLTCTDQKNNFQFVSIIFKIIFAIRI